MLFCVENNPENAACYKEQIAHIEEIEKDLKKPILKISEDPCTFKRQTPSAQSKSPESKFLSNTAACLRKLLEQLWIKLFLKYRF